MPGKCPACCTVFPSPPTRRFFGGARRTQGLRVGGVPRAKCAEGPDPSSPSFPWASLLSGLLQSCQPGWAPLSTEVPSPSRSPQSEVGHICGAGVLSCSWDLKGVFCTDPVEWNPGNVQKWLLWTEHQYRLPPVGKAFQELGGKELCAMSEEQFLQRSPLGGDVLHAHLDIWKSGGHDRWPLHENPSQRVDEAGLPLGSKPGIQPLLRLFAWSPQRVQRGCRTRIR